MKQETKEHALMSGVILGITAVMTYLFIRNNNRKSTAEDGITELLSTPAELPFEVRVAPFMFIINKNSIYGANGEVWHLVLNTWVREHY